MTQFAIFTLLFAHVATVLTPGAARRRQLEMLTLAAAIGFVGGRWIAPSAHVEVGGLMGLVVGALVVLVVAAISWSYSTERVGPVTCNLELPSSRPLIYW